VKHQALSRRAVRVHPAAVAVVIALALLTSLAVANRPVSATTATTVTAKTSTVTTTTTVARPRILAYYYLWWSRAHWTSLLGSHYPYTQSPLPLPARLDANGCNPVSNYVGNTLTDVPAVLGGQDDPGYIAADVAEAAAAGLTGFIVNWNGSGTAGQTVTSNQYNRRLQALFDAVHAINKRGIPFTLWISYKASASILTASHIANDLAYLKARYGTDTALDRSQSKRATLIWQGSRKYPVSTLQAISKTYRSTFRILGDESSWSTTRAPYLDGDAYYWSSQDPYKNPQSFTQLEALAKAVRASGVNPDGSRKAWIAPLAPGYDKQLAGGTNCVPRKGGQTMRALFNGNAKSAPDAYGLISWNEIAEGTYIDPMQRYGKTDLNMAHNLMIGS